MLSLLAISCSISMTFLRFSSTEALVEETLEGMLEAVIEGVLDSKE